MLTVGSLFSGIGGFDLGFERTGHMRTVWFCEQDPFCQRVLAKHWPGVPCHPDVRALVADTERADGGSSPQGRGSGEGGEGRSELGGGSDGRGLPVPVPYVDVLCGGFPCQDISLAGRGAGIGGSRSGLWGEFARLVGELRPRYVVVENVSAITSRGLDRVLGDLAACGFDAEWDHLPASAFGAPHRRDRFWLVAYSDVERTHRAGSFHEGWQEPSDGGGRTGGVGDSDGAPPDAYAQTGGSRPAVGERGWWEFEPDVGRVAHGIPNRVDRLRALGNSLVPQIAEWIGRRLVEYEAE